MEVKILMREIIKPYLETKPHLKTSKISIFDQMVLSVYFSSIFFYPMTNYHKVQNVTTKLKEALSKTLAFFYPLAGRINDNYQVECNDEGVLYLEARVGCDLSDFLQQPRLESLSLFHPDYTICTDLGVQLAIQVTTFSCGGIAIGMSFLHKIMDATTMAAFFKVWSGIARDSLSSNTATEVDSYNLMTMIPTLFPPREVLPAHLSWTLGTSVVKPGKSTLQRFVFSAEAISELRDKATGNSFTKATRIEAISALIWKCAIKAFDVAYGGSLECNSILMSMAVNLRRRMQPPLSENSLGNLVWGALTCLEKTSPKIEFPKLVSLLRTSIAKFDQEFVQHMVGNDGFETISQCFGYAAEMYSYGNVDAYTFSSWCKMGLDEVDFGWGKAVWVTPGPLPDVNIKNFVIFMETTANDGIEAWLRLDEHEMVVLENDPELLSFAEPNPSIFIDTPQSCVDEE